MAGKAVSVTFPETELKRLDIIAKRLFITRQQLIRFAVEEYIERKLNGG